MTGDAHWPNGRLRLNVPVFLARFGLRALGEAEPLPGGEDNINACVPTDRGEVVIREYVRALPGRARAEAALLGHLARRGYPTPAPLPSESGEPTVVVGGRPVAVFPFVHGEVPAETTAPLAEQCGALLARMHLDAADWSDAAVPVTDRRAVLEQALAVKLELAGTRLWRTDTRTFMAERAEALDLLEAQPSGPLHHDLHRGNVLVADGEVAAVLDFDELNRGPLVIDLARFLQYAALDRPDLRLPPAIAAAAIAGYRRVRPLSATELALLPVAFELALIVDAAGFIAWAAPYLDVRGVHECLSWQAYLANRGAFPSLEP